jgi:hypothetical protein
VEGVLTESPWPSVLLVAVLYSSDYVLTLICARLYQQRGRRTILIEGSFELNPIMQKHVDSGRWFSGRWLIGVGTLCVLFPVLWWLMTDIGWQQGYFLMLGGMVFLQLAVHTRHLRNLFLFVTALGDDGIRGRVEYPRWVVLSMSAFEFLIFAGLYAVSYVLTGSVLFMGGAALCLLMAAKHYGLRRRLRGNGAAAQQRDEAAEAPGGTRMAS